MSTVDDNADENVVNISDAVKEQLEQEDEAIALLGASDEQNCTYGQGYIDRQALFLCVTCDPLHETTAGVCYACSIHCHQGHDIIELYTKRNFRCDCGNTKFSKFKCTLQEEKDAINGKNTYNHNFTGKYCTCERPFPDPDDEVEDEMIQCILCEDWFHSRHLGCLPPAEYNEMVCDQCVKNNSFLQCYKEHTASPIATIVTKNESNGDVDVTTNDESLNENKDSSKESTTCKLEQSKTAMKTIEEEGLKVMFWVGDWRNKLCHCSSCLEMYKDKNITFIISEIDTIAFYEKKGKESVEKQWEEAADQISQMNRVQQLELVHGYNELKSGLTDFFSGFAENQVIRKEDVETFFEELNERKRRRLDGIPPANY